MLFWLSIKEEEEVIRRFAFVFFVFKRFVKTLVTRRHAPFLHAAPRAASLTLSTHGELNSRPSRTGRNLNYQEIEILSRQTMAMR